MDEPTSDELKKQLEMLGKTYDAQMRREEVENPEAAKKRKAAIDRISATIMEVEDDLGFRLIRAFTDLRRKQVLFYCIHKLILVNHRDVSVSLNVASDSYASNEDIELWCQVLKKKGFTEDDFSMIGYSGETCFLKFYLEQSPFWRTQLFIYS